MRYVERQGVKVNLIQVCGCSLFLDDINLLVDTPEDIAYGINYCDIKRLIEFYLVMLIQIIL